jgi:hypothetical protein
VLIVGPYRNGLYIELFEDFMQLFNTMLAVSVQDECCFGWFDARISVTRSMSRFNLF